MATKITNKANVTAWLPDMKISFTGTISAAAIELFRCIPDASTRLKALDVMRDHHEAERIKHVQT